MSETTQLENNALERSLLFLLAAVASLAHLLYGMIFKTNLYGEVWSQSDTFLSLAIPAVCIWQIWDAKKKHTTSKKALAEIHPTKLNVVIERKYSDEEVYYEIFIRSEASLEGGLINWRVGVVSSSGLNLKNYIERHIEADVWFESRKPVLMRIDHALIEIENPRSAINRWDK